MKKPVLYNGVEVGQIEKSDWTQEFHDADALIEGLGIRRLVPLADQIFNQATSFASAALDLHDKMMSTVEYSSRRAAVPFAANGVFAVELYLKALAAKHGQMMRGHQLAELYKNLPKAAKAAVKQAIPKAVADRKYDRPVNLSATLLEMSRAYEKWRYAYEEDRLRPLDIAALILTMAALNGAYTFDSASKQ